MVFFAVFILNLIVILYLSMKYKLLQDKSASVKPPYSFSRVQLAWWTSIIISCFVSIVLSTGKIPTLRESALILLGIGAATTASSRLIDISDDSNYAAANTSTSAAPPLLSKDQPSENFLIDILSDTTGVSIHRLQAFIFNVAIGCWFLYTAYHNITGLHAGSDMVIINEALPDVTSNNLILLGVSAGTYVTLKTLENR